MATKRIEFKEVIGENTTHIKIEVYYNLGGMNYFSGTNEKRGIYFSVSPVSRSVFGSGLVSESYTVFSGTKILLKEMKKFSQKVLDEFVVSKEVSDKIIEHVLNKNGLTLKQ